MLAGGSPNPSSSYALLGGDRGDGDREPVLQAMGSVQVDPPSTKVEPKSRCGGTAGTTMVNTGNFAVPLADPFEQLMAAQRLVGNDENVRQDTSS